MGYVIRIRIYERLQRYVLCFIDMLSLRNNTLRDIYRALIINHNLIWIYILPSKFFSELRGMLYDEQITNIEATRQYLNNYDFFTDAYVSH